MRRRVTEGSLSFLLLSPSPALYIPALQVLFLAKFQRVIFGSSIISQPRKDFQETLGTEVALMPCHSGEFVPSAGTSPECTRAQRMKLNTRLCIKPIAHTQAKET